MHEKYIKLFYVIWSKIYDTILDKLFKFDRKETISELKINKRDKILEIGVGSGLNLEYYPKYCHVYGIDLSKSMLEKAKNKTIKAKLNLEITNAESLKYKNNYFDKALSTYTLRVCKDPNKVLKEISRVVKPKGIFVIFDQFKENKKVSIRDFFSSIIGWGKNIYLDDIIKYTSWKVIKIKNKPSNVKLIVLKNVKNE
ncbi:class I SAM-dependent methyltransferase [Candidatus Woesearchaeota archaeon]|nr:class I SAM-dependent methyltransferase [Candidatus Woesearchaeota archaeon]